MKKLEFFERKSRFSRSKKKGKMHAHAKFRWEEKRREKRYPLAKMKRMDEKTSHEISFYKSNDSSDLEKLGYFYEKVFSSDECNPSEELHEDICLDQPKEEIYFEAEEEVLFAYPITFSDLYGMCGDDYEWDRCERVSSAKVKAAERHEKFLIRTKLKK